MSLQGKVAIVTGDNSGIAKAIGDRAFGVEADDGASSLAATTIFADGGIMHSSPGL